MNSAVWLALAATTGTWLLTALGAATVIFFRRTDAKVWNLCLGFAAGVMVAASFWSLLEPAIEQANKYSTLPAWLCATLGFCAGAFFMLACDAIVSHAGKHVGTGGTADGTRAHADNTHDGTGERLRRVILLVLSITLHNIPEGLAVGVAFGALHNGMTPEGLMGAITVALGIGFQNFPEGAAVALPLRREGCSRTKSFLIGQASGIVEPVAGVIGALAVVCIQSILPYALSFAAGAMIAVAVHELIPECQQERTSSPYSATIGIVFGFALMMLLDVALG